MARYENTRGGPKRLIWTRHIPSSARRAIRGLKSRAYHHVSRPWFPALASDGQPVLVPGDLKIQMLMSVCRLDERTGDTMLGIIQQTRLLIILKARISTYSEREFPRFLQAGISLRGKRGNFVWSTLPKTVSTIQGTLRDGHALVQGAALALIIALFPSVERARILRREPKNCSAFSVKFPSSSRLK